MLAGIFRKILWMISFIRRRGAHQRRQNKYLKAIKIDRRIRETWNFPRLLHINYDSRTQCLCLWEAQKIFRRKLFSKISRRISWKRFVSWRFMVRNFISSTYLCLSLICFPSWPILISFNWKQWERSQFRLKDRQNRKQRVFQLLEILVHWQVSVWDVQNIFEACATLPSTQVFKKREGVYAYQR